MKISYLMNRVSCLIGLHDWRIEKLEDDWRVRIRCLHCEKRRELEEIRAVLVRCEDSVRLAELEALYSELVMAVSRKFSGESRHQTALRYIIEAESNHSSGAPKQHENI